MVIVQVGGFVFPCSVCRTNIPRFETPSITQDRAKVGKGRGNSSSFSLSLSLVYLPCEPNISKYELLGNSKCAYLSAYPTYLDLGINIDRGYAHGLTGIITSNTYYLPTYRPYITSTSTSTSTTTYIHRL